MFLLPVDFHFRWQSRRRGVVYIYDLGVARPFARDDELPCHLCIMQANRMSLNWLFMRHILVINSIRRWHKNCKCT